ncbi:MAG: type II secretion system protein N [Gammaproteobacteria bacterium]|nr:type II secretion system protein N [Gammaproteobacteria bacterium]
MTRTTKRLLGVAAASFVFFLVLNIPAQVILSFLDGTPAKMNGLSGTLWQGAAKSFAVDQLQFGQARWRWKPGGLLAGRVEFDFEAGDSEPRLSGRLGLSASGKILVRNATLDLFLNQLGVMPFGTKAKVFIAIESLSMAGEWPEHATGTIHLIDTSMDIPETLELGDFEGQFKIENGGDLQADFYDLEGALEINGTLSLDARGNYQGNLYIKPRGRLSRRLQNILSYMPSENGVYQQPFSGSL